MHSCVIIIPPYFGPGYPSARPAFFRTVYSSFLPGFCAPAFFQATTGSSRSDSCPATRGDSNGLASARPAEFAGFSHKNPAPTFSNPPSGGASIGGVQRFMGGLI